MDKKIILSVCIAAQIFMLGMSWCQVSDKVLGNKNNGKNEHQETVSVRKNIKNAVVQKITHMETSCQHCRDLCGMVY